MASIMTTMAGNVWKINVKVGDEISPGDEVVILESMKMEIPIEAETGGTVSEILVEEGSFVNEEEVIVKLD
ncbi:acetyl-CoA carboxylase biotin carboxyl carrier protein subunit [Alkalicoccus halolimnae]|uniref:Acetyl-CoA carboxylase biotin carboxyl carrier protein subunit n=1 Tax=Alkalicoccus halolimnae TaxID=1667239 RepID=A0A5C7FGX6_9BACI|nr:acetyl-CoA carboxylase biotin carboxyl carrier protein subunit [Alkalicoccus halolimnae]TXF86557.1 acetyl-CoA carboxylase biotin carboxyl carrier protein subunit [Alkalicoccus halolimnae]